MFVHWLFIPGAVYASVSLSMVSFWLTTLNSLTNPCPIVFKRRHHWNGFFMLRTVWPCSEAIVTTQWTLQHRSELPEPPERSNLLQTGLSALEGTDIPADEAEMEIPGLRC